MRPHLFRRLTLLTYLLTASLLAAPAWAQRDRGGSPEDDVEQAKQQVAEMEGLDLSETQKSQLVQQMAKQNAQQRNDRALWRVGLHPRQLSPLELAGDQKKQVRGVLNNIGGRMIEQWRAQQKPGAERWGYPQWRAFMLTLREEANGRIGEHLSEEQLAQWKEMAAKHEEHAKARYEQWEQRQAEKKAREEAAARGELTAGAGAAKETAEQEIARRLKAALAALDLPGEEAATLKPLLEALIRHKVTGTRALATRRATIAKARPEGEAATEQLTGYRTQLTRYRERLTELEERVRELVTVPQEALLVGLDVLS